MFYTGFADEAGSGIDIQIKATKALGWKNIECRNIDGVNLTDISDEKFEEVCGKLADAKISINCFGSAVANWAKDPRKEEDFQKSIEELKRALPRMKKLGTKIIRGMSFQAVQDAVPDSPEIEAQVFRKVKHLVKMCEDSGVIYGHENCMNYGGLSWQHSLRLLENVDSPALKLIFDTGNPAGTDDHAGKKPYKKQDAFEFYSHVKDHIVYVHIKDAKFVKDSGGLFPGMEYTFPGEGNARIREIMTDLLASGYDNGFSMEPHMAALYHDGSVKSKEEAMFENYVEYGRRFMALIDEIKGKRSK